MRQNAVRRLRNRNAKKNLKMQLKKVQAAAKAGGADALKQEVRLAFRKLDQAAAKGVIHRNAAARRKSQLHRMLAAAAATSPPTETAPTS